MITTARMRLTPADVALARAEMKDRAEFARLLSASVPDDWPPELLADASPLFLGWIEAAPDRIGWYVWYAVLRAAREASELLVDGPEDILMACGGFKGPPEDGAVEIGYSVLPRFQGQGYGVEMVRALVDWAFAQPGVARIVADTEAGNRGSIRLLRRLGFVEVGPGAETGHLRFALTGSMPKD